jgi:hypothetical protein
MGRVTRNDISPAKNDFSKGHDENIEAAAHEKE